MSCPTTTTTTTFYSIANGNISEIERQSAAIKNPIEEATNKDILGTLHHWSKEQQQQELSYEQQQN